MKILLLLAAVAVLPAADAPPSGLYAGVARADITPPVGIAHLNWGSQTHVAAAGIIRWACTQPPWRCRGKQKFAMVDIDALVRRSTRRRSRGGRPS